MPKKVSDLKGQTFTMDASMTVGLAYLILRLVREKQFVLLADSGLKASEAMMFVHTTLTMLEAPETALQEIETRMTQALQMEQLLDMSR